MKNKSRGKIVTIFHSEFREDLKCWVKTTDHKVALKVLELVEAVVKNPFEGIGKPETLRYLGSGVWSRKITQEHRIVDDKKIDFVQCRYHY
ncbi:MAG: Txe/YoeB family addiction module toxin [Ignavibacteria bacterium]